MDHLANPIRAYRNERKLSIDTMAKKLGVSSASLSRIERGDQWPSREFFERLEQATCGVVKADDLVRFHHSPTRRAG